MIVFQFFPSCYVSLWLSSAQAEFWCSRHKGAAQKQRPLVIWSRELGGLHHNFTICQGLREVGTGWGKPFHWLSETGKMERCRTKGPRWDCPNLPSLSSAGLLGLWEGAEFPTCTQESRGHLPSTLPGQMDPRVSQGSGNWPGVEDCHVGPLGL